jgi:DNA-binding MarR family transcriptional regulator
MTVCRTWQCVIAHYCTAMATPNDPCRCYALAARKNARHLSRLYDRWLAPAELSISQFSILALLDVHGQLKITELADMLSMERTSLVRALNPLQTAGWVVAERPDSGRSFDVKLSGRGHKKLAQALPLWKSAQAAFERQVGRDRAVRLRDEILELNSER